MRSPIQIRFTQFWRRGGRAPNRGDVAAQARKCENEDGDPDLHGVLLSSGSGEDREPLAFPRPTEYARSVPNGTLTSAVL